MKRISWTRVVIAAILSEVGVIAVLGVAIALYSWLTPTMTDAQFDALGEEIGYYVAPAAGIVTTALSVLWAARRLTSDFIRHGVLIGLVSVLLTFWFIFGARPEHRVMYVVAFGLRIVGGFAGGLLAQRLMKTTPNAAARFQTAP